MWDLTIKSPNAMPKSFGGPLKQLLNLTINSFDVDSAITIANNLGDETFHFPIDILSSLAHVNQSLLLDDSVYLHVKAKTDYVMDWLSIAGISSDRVTSGDIRAKRLFVPEANLEGVSRAQLSWLQNKVWSAIGFPELSKRNLLIIQKRHERGISNHDEQVRLSKEHATVNGLEVYIHDDENLPPVKEQLELFSRVAMLVAPHGAGELFMIASLPGACVIEMFPAYYHDLSLAQLMTSIGHHYTGLDLLADGSHFQGWGNNNPNTPVNTTDLRLAMERCSNRKGIP